MFVLRFFEGKDNPEIAATIEQGVRESSGLLGEVLLVAGGEDDSSGSDE